MSNFDFTTLPPNQGCGSFKWEDMRKKDPNVPQDIVPLSCADMEFVHPECLIRAMQSFWETAVMRYTNPTGEYFAAVERWMQQRHAWRIEREWVVPFSGIVPALHVAVRAFTKPGDGVAMLTPVYHPFFDAVRKAERTLVTVDLKRAGEHYEIDYQALEAALSKPETTLLLFCSPHNPVGRVWREEELAQVARLCRKYDVTIVSDEIHSDLIMPGFTHTPFASLPEAAPRCVVCTAPSKTFNIAGLKASNLIIPDPALRKRLLECKDLYGGYGLTATAIYACQTVYNTCGAWLDELISVIRGNRDLIARFMQENIPQIHVLPMEGTYLQWWDCRGLGLDAQELETFMQQKARLFANEGYVFGEAGRGFERINLACPTWVLEQMLHRLKLAVSELNPGT